VVPYSISSAWKGAKTLEEDAVVQEALGKFVDQFVLLIDEL
jgi:hypothetical protein